MVLAQLLHQRQRGFAVNRNWSDGHGDGGADECIYLPGCNWSP